MPNSIRPLVAAFIGVAILAGCDSSTDPVAAAAGTYVLVTVEGESLPTVVQTGDGAVEIVSGQMVLNANGACGGSLVVREPGTEPTMTMASTCTWTRAGSEVTVNWSDGATDVATLQGNQLTLVAEDLGGLALVFQR
jgi:hypothetical protein